MKNYSRSPGRKTIRGSKSGPKTLLSFEFLDIQQGQTLRDWDKDNNLLKLQEMGAKLNKETPSQAIFDGTITIYEIGNKAKWSIKNMPKVSKWNYPVTVSKADILWAKIELGRKLRVIGYFEENVFYVVFLDKNHQFYPSKV